MRIKNALGLIMLIVPILALVAFVLYAGQGVVLLVGAGIWCWGMIVAWLLTGK